MRNVLITGAGSGLGRGLSLCLARLGHSILVTDIDAARAGETAAQIAAAGGRAEAHALDVTLEADVQRFVGGPGGRPVEVLVNNAGVQHVAPLEAFPADRWDALVDVLLLAAPSS